MKVMVLSGRFGFGHEMAANAIREELIRQNPDAGIIQKDLLTYFYPHISRLIYGVFSLVAERCHGIYNLVYRMSERMNAEIRQGGSMLYLKFRRMMEEETPDMIVCTHPICVKAAAFYKAKTGSQVPLISCITDTSIHMGWVAEQVDTYLVPTPEMKEYLIHMGTWADVLTTGIPVRQQFLAQSVCEERRAAAALGKRILVMGGGLGIMPGLEELMDSLHRMKGVRATVITGKNQKLYQRWAGRYEDVEVLGYVGNIADYIRRSDLVITKAGGITMYELIHSEVPMFIIHPFLEQEIMNARYALERGFARVVWEQDADFVQELEALLANSGRLEDMKESMRRAKEEMIDTPLQEAAAEMFRKARRYRTSSGYSVLDCFVPLGPADGSKAASV
ncbi:MAG: hypothetical protein K1W22_10625 [Lachnospiraceae bacterium]